jgi:hypothetical protein
MSQVFFPMKPKACLFLSLLLAPAVLAQSSNDAGEIVELSPFQITSSDDRGYRTNNVSSIIGRMPVPDPFPSVPVTLIKRADAVVVQFALSNSADKQDVRNKNLSSSIEAIAAAIKSVSGLKLEHREVRLSSGDRAGSWLGKGGVVTSFANIAVFADLSAEMRLYERVKQVKDLVAAAKLVGETKLIDGPAGLYLRRPNDYRKELLGKIFEDLENVKKGLGSDFEVLVSGLTHATRLRPCSETDIELWVDYSFTIRSIRELDGKKNPTKA